ncbi:uncharacterized protein TRIADDRAFT_57300 [Trichoplax adhaerens]|uniref:Uridine diphosphate glucose pyrophosphatase NUDT14 n=1 Tax=Trichoplax adhaerens TaxID=10228 RepID=B3RZ23_TRIAD|nr:hypothetical protein TRIADDRAFT_57300 [Trichoplax adhaerens]EDV23769.1 hypothetical protein TRIADDRAFT_57300 [Trichoplax adhaerens]|eukprot:XP_002113295.1 hypothetical protein TRIADDRAFT_57300 [Trichoplax adhaerens]
MDQIRNVIVGPCGDSAFVKPRRLTFEQNGRKRQWDYIIMHDSVSILLLNTTRQAFILVKQLRPVLFPYLHGDEIPSLLNDKDAQPRRELPMEIANNAITYELCSGIVDKDKSLVKIAQDEILEECGYFIPEDKIHRITSGRRVGTSGCKQTYFYAECTDDMIVSSGGGVEAEGEMIDVYYLPIDEAREFIFDDSLIKPAGLIMAFLWFFQYSPNLNGINDFVNAKNK